MATEPESKIPVCPVCGGNVYHVANTWTTADGLIHRQRVCALCELWAYQSVEKPERVPGASGLVEAAETTATAVETVEKPSKSTANANLGSLDLTQSEQTHTVTAKAGGRVPPWKCTRPPAEQPTRKG